MNDTKRSRPSPELAPPSNAPAAIDPRSTVNDVVLRHPLALEVFAAFGVHTCCGGGATLDAAARDAGVAPDVLLAALESATLPEDR